MRRFVVAIAALVLAACGGSSSKFPGAASACAVEAVGADVIAARCIESTNARVLAVRVDGAGEVILAGTFQGRLAFDERNVIGAPGRSSQAFAAKLGSDLEPRYARPLDAPGALRGIFPAAAGLGIVTAFPDAPGAGQGGPFLTRLDASGNVSQRKDLGFGGLVTSVTSDASGAIVLRVQQDGLRVVVASADGNVLASPRVAPAWIAQFPASVASDALVPDVALAPSGAYLAHARGPSEDGAIPDQALTKLASNGTVAWTRPAPVGHHARIVPYGAGVAVLTPRAGAICPGALGRSFAVSALDGEGNVRWQRCFAARAEDLHLVVDAGGHVVVAGALKEGDLGDGPRSAPPKGVASFVVRLGDRGESERIVYLGGRPIVALHGIAAAPNGNIVVAGAAASKSSAQTHVFVATLR